MASWPGVKKAKLLLDILMTPNHQQQWGREGNTEAPSPSAAKAGLPLEKRSHKFLQWRHPIPSLSGRGGGSKRLLFTCCFGGCFGG